jgi:parallel beta-helix repeat protein
LGDYDTFQYNLVKNCYAVNANHDDGFQSWSSEDSGVGTGVVYGMVLRGNTIINYENPDQPFRGTLQGIGCFDGMFENWLVENNVVITDHWHGITLSGATNCKIINNTVVDINDTTPGPPWISIGDHKNGTLSTGCVVRNNLSTSFNISSQGVAQDHNITIKKYDEFFVNYSKKDLHLKAGCSAIDSGSSDAAPVFDKDKNARPFGTRVDIGAYEWGYTGIIHNLHSFQTTSPLSCKYNPSKKTVVISVKDATIDHVSVIDIRGRMVLSFVNNYHHKVVWDTGHTGRGVYIIKAVANNRLFLSTMVISH